jgi:hypothetical protein
MSTTDYDAMSTEELRKEWGELIDTAKGYEGGQGFVKKYAGPYYRKAREVQKIITARGEACYWCGGVQGWVTDANNEDRCIHCNRPERHSEKAI